MLPWPVPGVVLNLRQATTTALRQRPDLWLDPALNMLETSRINAQVAQLSHQVSRAWVEAVAANQSAAYLQDALEAAEAGAELAQRMAAVGNWSQMQRVQTRLLQSDAATALAAARQQLWVPVNGWYACSACGARPPSSACCPGCLTYPSRLWQRKGWRPHPQCERRPAGPTRFLAGPYRPARRTGWPGPRFFSRSLWPGAGRQCPTGPLNFDL